MAAASRPGAEARVPCPVCGALVHPVAGRCKHCKEDLRAFRSARPAAAVALPRLGPAPAAPPAPVPYAPVALPGAPILPPRVTASRDLADPDARSAWRHWPIVVIVVAVVAILGAFAVMLWPPSKQTAGTHGREPPAPLDHMDTQPLAPPAAPAAPAAPPDPWTDPHAQRDPLQIPPDDPRPDPLAKPSLDDDDAVAPNIDLLAAAMQHFCRARAGCPGGDPVIEGACMAIAQQHPTPPTCAASRRCLARFDHMRCSDTLDLAGIQNLFATFDDCTQATRC